jgi:hypothetical protein
VALAEIVYFTDVSLPNSAVVVRSEFTEFLRPLLLARLDLPCRDMDSVRNTPTLKGNWSQGVDSSLASLFRARGYWTPPPPGAKGWYAYGPAPRRDRPRLREHLQVVDVILIEWDQNTAVVYVYAAGN